MARRGSQSQRRIISLVSLAITLAVVLVPTISNLRSSPQASAQASVALPSASASSGADAGSAAASAESASGSLSTPPTATPSSSSNRVDPRLRRIGFASQRGLDSHWRKHGAEFNVSTKAQYLSMAQDLRDAPLSSRVIEASQSNGSYARFDRRTGGFLAFNRDLTIRTFFRPDDGESYFRRAVNRR